LAKINCERCNSRPSSISRQPPEIQHRFARHPTADKSTLQNRKTRAKTRFFPSPSPTHIQTWHHRFKIYWILLTNQKQKVVLFPIIMRTEGVYIIRERASIHAAI
jgi:hypothetical protein